jgi:hypothetical protein
VFDGPVRPLALGLETHMRSHFFKGDLDVPAGDEPLEDLCGKKTL